MVPGVVIFGAGGAVVGFVGGGIYGSISGLSGPHAEAANAALERVEQRDVAAELLAALVAAVPTEKQVGLEKAQALVTARVYQFDLHQHTSQRLSLSVRASLVQEWERDAEDPQDYTCAYEFRTPTRDVEEFLLDDGLAFDAAISEGLTTIARWMARDLNAFATKIEQPEAEGLPRTCFRD